MIASKEYVLSKLNEYTLFPKKKYGQNFLIDEKTVSKIVAALDIKQGDVIYEIGPGLGALSEVLASKNQPLYLYDIDENMVDHLKVVFKMFPHVEVINENFLKVEDDNKVTKIIGNLPYYITTSLIEHVLINFDISDFVFMVQAEVEERLIAKIKTKEYGPLSILIDQFFEIEKVCKVSKMAFYPVPHVDSAVFRIKYKPTEENKKKQKANSAKGGYKYEEDRKKGLGHGSAGDRAGADLLRGVCRERRSLCGAARSGPCGDEGQPAGGGGRLHRA